MKKRVILPLLMVVTLLMSSCATQLGGAEAADEWLAGVAAMAVAGGIAVDDNNMDASVSDSKTEHAEMSPFELLSSLGNMDGADSFSMNMMMVMSMEVMGMAMDVTANMDIAQVMTDDGYDMAMTMSIGTFGVDMAQESYVKDGWQYTNSEGMKIKTPAIGADVSMFEDLTGVTQFPGEAVLDQNAEYVDGDIVLSFVLDGAAVMGATDMLMDMTGMAEMGTISELSDIEMGAIITDGALSLMYMSFTCEIDMMEMIVPVTYDIVINILQIGGVTIEFPEDLDEYELLEY